MDLHPGHTPLQNSSVQIERPRAAAQSGIRANGFRDPTLGAADGFGFGPRLFGFKRGDTDYRVSAIPFGGYVKMAGDQSSEASAIEDPRSVLAKPRWQRLLIAFAGPFMNIALAVAVLAGLYMVSFPKLSPADEEAVIGDVMPDSPAAKAGIQAGDRIVRIDDKKNPTWEDVTLKEIASAYRLLSVTVERSEARLELRRQGDRWEMYAPFPARVDQGTVTRLMDAFENARLTDALSFQELRRRELSLKEFGLAPASACLILHGPLREDKVWIGALSPLKKEVYVRMNELDQVLDFGERRQLGFYPC